MKGVKGRYPLQRIPAVQDARRKRVLWSESRQLDQPLSFLETFEQKRVPIINIYAHSPQLLRKKPTVHLLIAPIPHAPRALMIHDYQRTAFLRRLGRRVDPHNDLSAVAHRDPSVFFADVIWNRAG